MAKTNQMNAFHVRRHLALLCAVGLAASLSGFAQTRPVAAASSGTAAATATSKNSAHKNVTHKKTAKAVPAPPVEPEPVVVVAPTPPPPPPTPGELPPNAPNVTFADGELTIAAENSTLAQILSAVSSATGATMDVPPRAGSERVWISLGPGPARAVLAALLTGTDLDYVIQSADNDQTQIQSVLLTARAKGGASPGLGSPAYASRQPNRGFRGRSDSGASDGQDSENSNPADSASIPPADGSATAAVAQPDGTPAAPDRAAAEAAAANPSSPNSLANSLSARLPSNISEADAHPTPIADPQQGVPQLLNLFELRRQLQEQQNAQQKATGTR